MINNTGIKNALIDVDDSVLVLIDIQDCFLDRHDRAVSEALVAKVAWIIHLARHLGVPIVAMAEDVDTRGNLNQTILNALPNGQRVHDKDAFNLTDNPEILADLDATGRKTVILMGMETDVCVAHSALGLMGNGYRAAVLKDAVATAPGGAEFGLSRMADAGALITSVRSLYYEWLRSVTNCKTLRAATAGGPLAKRPDGLGF
ncbi:MAG: isochorismatase family protein [Rhodospirillaceae bacterium]|nr:isochorismatase family protein [Rhodospirillaceae bacterium]